MYIAAFLIYKVGKAVCIFNEYYRDQQRINAVYVLYYSMVLCAVKTA
jgi:hypothetical protein